ncbi:hypothetical protein BUALT_Bualt17G0081900 [Buddleja alternifolia]|uniref:C2 domain-containing protein n=1 Tax=Buddleja alternifolia TaxID=168488 RepID=A0AAV6W7K9_9LAMI|nr:hypothetical protein BUALT_Bualt17G0081900 [Buddleja alternifolia]
MLDAGEGSKPKWDETFLFKVTDNVTELKIRIMDKDTFTADDFVGEVRIPLEPVFEEDMVEPTSYNVVKDEKYCGGLELASNLREDNQFFADHPGAPQLFEPSMSESNRLRRLKYARKTRAQRDEYLMHRRSAYAARSHSKILLGTKNCSINVEHSAERVDIDRPPVDKRHRRGCRTIAFVTEPLPDKQWLLSSVDSSCYSRWLPYGNGKCLSVYNSA